MDEMATENHVQRGLVMNFSNLDPGTPANLLILPEETTC